MNINQQEGVKQILYFLLIDPWSLPKFSKRNLGFVRVTKNILKNIQKYLKNYAKIF